MEIKDKESHRVVSTAIIRKKDGPLNGEVNRYLILQRSPDKKVFPGKWTVPGGGLEVSDYINTPKTTADAWYYAIENSLRREINEEANLEVKKLQYLCDMTFVRPDGIPVVILSYYCDYKSGDVQLNEESADYKWVTPSEAKNYDLIEGLLEEIEMADRILKGKNSEEISWKQP